MRRIEKNGSLAEKHPVLSAQWHPTKNGKMTPEKITLGSDYKAWWICSDCGQEWMAVVGSRSKGHSAGVTENYFVNVALKNKNSLKLSEFLFFMIHH